MAKLETIEGIGPKFAQLLRKAGVRSTNDLLKKGGAPAARKRLSKDTGISVKLILEWVNHSDLFRIKGVGGEFADLLEEAGVDTVIELARRSADKLYESMIKANAKKKMVRQMPGLSKVEGWVRQAKKLPPMINY